MITEDAVENSFGSSNLFLTKQSGQSLRFIFFTYFTAQNLHMLKLHLILTQGVVVTEY